MLVRLKPLPAPERETLYPSRELTPSLDAVLEETEARQKEQVKETLVLANLWRDELESMKRFDEAMEAAYRSTWRRDEATGAYIYVGPTEPVVARESVRLVNDQGLCAICEEPGCKYSRPSRR